MLKVFIVKRENAPTFFEYFYYALHDKFEGVSELTLKEFENFQKSNDLSKYYFRIELVK